MTWSTRRVYASRQRQAVRREGWRQQRVKAAAEALAKAHELVPTLAGECDCVWCLAGEHQATCSECAQFWNPDPAKSASQLCRIGERIEAAIAAEFLTA